MKIEMTTDNYSNAQGFRLVGAGIHEVDERRAKHLLTTFPSWFRAADGTTQEEKVTNTEEPTVVQDETGVSDTPEVSAEEPSDSSREATPSKSKKGGK